MKNIENGIVMEVVSFEDIARYGYANVYHLTDEWVCNYNTPNDTAIAFKDYAQQYQSMAGSMFGNSEEYIAMMTTLSKSCYLGEAYVNATRKYNQGWGLMIPDADVFFECLKDLLNEKVWAGISQNQINKIIEWKKAIY